MCFAHFHSAPLNNLYYIKIVKPQIATRPLIILHSLIFKIVPYFYYNIVSKYVHAWLFVCPALVENHNFDLLHFKLALPVALICLTMNANQLSRIFWATSSVSQCTKSASSNFIYHHDKLNQQWARIFSERNFARLVDLKSLTKTNNKNNTMWAQ